MVWVYEHTGTLLVTMLMHTSLLAMTRLAFPPNAVMANVISGWAVAAMFWVVVAAVALAKRRKPAQGPPPKEQAASRRRTERAPG
jgi:hypothetical protein